MPTEDLSWLKNRFVLLDTNILIDSAKYPVEFKSFYDLLSNNNVKSVFDYTVNFEFLSHATSLKESKDYHLFLDHTFGAKKNQLQLPTSSQLFKVAQNISLIANRMDNNKISLADCLIGAQMAQYSDGSLFLATQNHSDFPACIYDLLFKQIIRLKNGKIKLIGFYKLNKDRYTSLVDDLLISDNSPKSNRRD